MVQIATKPATCMYCQPKPYRNTGRPTTNHTSREPNMKIRAAAMRLIARVLANSSRKLFDDFALPSVRGKENSTPIRTTASIAAISHNAGRNPATCNRKPPMKNPAPLVAFFDTVNHATQRNNCPAPSVDVALIALFDAVLVRSFATPATPWAITTQMTDTTAPHAGSDRKS